MYWILQYIYHEIEMWSYAFKDKLIILFFFFINTEKPYNHRTLLLKYINTYIKAGNLAWNQELNMTRDCIFCNTRLKPRLAQFIASSVNSHSSLIVVYTAQYNVYWPTC